MTNEVGFIHMPASILGAGLLDNIVIQCERYTKEKEMVNKLINARYDIDKVAERSRELVAGLIREQLNKWWMQSRYNVQVDTMRELIMKTLYEEIRKYERNIVKTRGQNLFVEGLREVEFESVAVVIKRKWPGLIMYYEPNVDPETVVPMH